MNIDGTTKVVGVFGSPIEHTASPAIHNAAFAALNMNWVYVAFRVEPQNLRAAVTGARNMGLTGVNLTLPHKILALDIVDEVHSEARRLGSVNTVLMEHGKLRGFNTDGYGFVKAIEEEFNLTLEGKRVLVLGAGGAGRAIAVKCALEDAALVCVANRTPEKIESIAKEIAATKTAFRALKLNSKDIARHMEGIDLLVNATSVGLKPGETLELDPTLFSSKLFVYDTIYRPAKTELLRLADEAGAKSANGASMLVHQGAKSFEIWTRRKAPVAVMRRALKALIGEEPH